MTINFFGREIEIGKNYVVAAVSILLVALGITGFLLRKNEADITVINKEDIRQSSTVERAEPYAAADSMENADKEKKLMIKVYVAGAVKNPGIVTLEKGQIIDDAVKAAGGATADADLDNINLAYILNENVMIKIGSKKQAKEEMNANAAPKASKSTSVQASGSLQVIKDSGGAVENEPIQAEKSNGKININTATAEELDKLPGVGVSTAQKIIAYRESNGKFKTAADIMKVSGIGQSKYNSMKDFITVD